MPSVAELAKLRDTWPEHWGDVLPTPIKCTPEYMYLRDARPESERKMYSKMITDPTYDTDWLRSLATFFKINPL